VAAYDVPGLRREPGASGFPDSLRSLPGDIRSPLGGILDERSGSSRQRRSIAALSTQAR